MGTLVVMEADGTNMRELDNSVQNACKGDAPGGKVAWAPSGDKIAFTRTVNGLPNLESNDNAGGLHQIFIAHVDGRELQQITDDGYNYHPKWSPDGKHIVFLRSSVSDLDEYMWRESPDNLFVMKADGSDMQQLTDLESQLPGDRIWHRIWQASWSPDGREIAFTVYRVRDENDELTSSENIYIISADGVDLRKVTDFGYSDLPYLADVEWAIVPDPPMTAENDTLATIEADNRNLAATIEANNAVATATKDNENLLATITAGNQVPTAVSNDPAFTKGEAIGVVRAHLSKLTWTLNQATGPSTFPCTSLSGELVDAEYEHGDRVWTVTSEKGMSWLFYERTGAVVRNSTGGASLVC